MLSGDSGSVESEMEKDILILNKIHEYLKYFWLKGRKKSFGIIN